MNTGRRKRTKAVDSPPEPTILSREIITDQSDPSMIKFREENGEFKPGCPRKTVKLEITEYDKDSSGLRMTTQFGFYEGPPPPGYTEFMSGLIQKAIDDLLEKKKNEKWSQDMNISTRTYRTGDRRDVVRLWTACGLPNAWAAPELDIRRRLQTSPDLFMVGVVGEKVVGTVIGRCDEKRGWVEYLAMDPSLRRKGIGSHLLKAIEKRLSEKGCSSAGFLMDRQAHSHEFCHKAGYLPTDVLLAKKRLTPN